MGQSPSNFGKPHHNIGNLLKKVDFIKEATPLSFKRFKVELSLSLTNVKAHMMEHVKPNLFLIRQSTDVCLDLLQYLCTMDYYDNSIAMHNVG